MSTGFEGRVAIVTGGSRGIGNGIARRLADLGASVLITSRKQDAVDAAAAEIGGDVVPVAAHVASEDAARRCFDIARERWGRVDVLVNNVGVNTHVGSTLAITRAAFDKMTETNLWASLMWVRLATDAGLGETAGAAVVNVSSNLSLAPGGPSAVYGMTKAALNYLTQQLAVELAPRIRVNAVLPGVVETDMAAMLVNQGERLTRGWPIPRFGQPCDVADVVEFLAGSQSSWMTGQLVTVDGGARLTSASDLMDWDAAGGGRAEGSRGA